MKDCVTFLWAALTVPLAVVGFLAGFIWFGLAAGWSAQADFFNWVDRETGGL